MGSFFLLSLKAGVSVIDISVWTDIFLRRLHATFPNRVWFVGLQGSYSRGEATDTSDIDMVVILDVLEPADLIAYRGMLDTLAHRELICGFLSGRNVLMRWEPFDLFMLYYDTVPLYGTIDSLLNLLDCEAVNRAIRVGACNIYHGCVHNMLHGRQEETLRELYKNALFVVQMITFRQTGKYIARSAELCEVAAPKEQEIVDICLGMKNGTSFDFDDTSIVLFQWAQGLISEECI